MEGVQPLPQRSQLLEEPEETPKVDMAPKAKVHPMAKVRVKAKAKPKGVGKAKARGVALVRGRRTLRRPAGVPPDVDRAQPQKVAWDAGHTVRGGDMSLDGLRGETGLVVEEARYFHRTCKVAGAVVGTLYSGNHVEVRLKPTGTTDEGILKLQSGQPRLELRVLLCNPACNHEETAEDLVHGLRIRKQRPADGEEPWVNNLEKVAGLEGPDELERLRTEMEERRKAADAPRTGAELKKEKGKKEKKEKKKKKEKERKKSSTSGDSVSGVAALDGTKARQASQKKPKALFAGTGLDPLDKVRSRALRLAKRYVKKKGKKASSDSDSTSGSSPGARLEEESETIFQQAARVRGIADAYPGVLANQALGQMRANLLQTLGEAEGVNTLPVVAVQYYRQVLQKKSSGPMSRELLTLCAASDLLARGKAAQCLDLLLQRVKSAESTLSGTHWSVAQKLELLPSEQSSLTDAAEMREAQRIAFEESKTRWMSSLPEGRPLGSQKGGGKKGSGKEDYRRGADGKKGGKGQGKKGEWKKPEDSTPKAS